MRNKEEFTNPLPTAMFPILLPLILPENMEFLRLCNFSRHKLVGCTPIGFTYVYMPQKEFVVFFGPYIIPSVRRNRAFFATAIAHSAAFPP